MRVERRPFHVLPLYCRRATDAPGDCEAPDDGWCQRQSGMLDREQVKKAVVALLKHESGGAKGKKSQLFEETDSKVISLVLGMKEFPKVKRTKPHQIAVPHSLHSASEICIIVKDPQKALKERLEAEPIDGVVKVIGLTKLRDNYKTFEAKRNLCDSYDLFMVDRRVLPMLPKLIGKSFFQKKKCATSLFLQRQLLAERAV